MKRALLGASLALGISLAAGGVLVSSAPPAPAPAARSAMYHTGPTMHYGTTLAMYYKGKPGMSYGALPGSLN